MAVISAKNKTLPGNKSEEPAENTLGVRQCKLYLAIKGGSGSHTSSTYSLNLKNMQIIENVWSTINRDLRYIFNYPFLNLKKFLKVLQYTQKQ